MKIEDIEEEQLPDELKKLSPAERKKEIEKRIAGRKAIGAAILTLSKKRDEYLSGGKKEIK